MHLSVFAAVGRCWILLMMLHRKSVRSIWCGACDEATAARRPSSLLQHIFTIQLLRLISQEAYARQIERSHLQRWRHIDGVGGSARGGERRLGLGHIAQRVVRA